MLTAFESRRCLTITGRDATLALKEPEPVVLGTVAGPRVLDGVI